MTEKRESAQSILLMTRAERCIARSVRCTKGMLGGGTLGARQTATMTGTQENGNTMRQWRLFDGESGFDQH